MLDLEVRWVLLGTLMGKEPGASDRGQGLLIYPTKRAAPFAPTATHPNTGFGAFLKRSPFPLSRCCRMTLFSGAPPSPTGSRAVDWKERCFTFHISCKQAGREFRTSTAMYHRYCSPSAGAVSFPCPEKGGNASRLWQLT